MNQHLSDGAASAAEAIASNPKVAAAVSVVTTVMGTASVMSEIQTVLGIVSVVIGIAIGLYVLRINRIRSQIYQRMRDNGESFKE